MAGKITSFLKVSQIFLIFSITLSQCLNPPKNVPPKNFSRREMLDPDGKYILEWTVDWAENTITFNISAQTLGWVGFGLSNAGKMSGADVIIGGMHVDGQVYFSDRHAVANQVPLEDPQQSWTLLDCVETGSHTLLSVTRKLDTCDPQDYPITENKVSLIWALGNSDKEIKYHEGRRGAFEVYLLDPNWSPRITRDRGSLDPEVLDKSGGVNIPEDLRVWSVLRNVTIEGEEETSYLCSLHKGPGLKKKHHVIGFDVYLMTEISRRKAYRVHVFKCHVPLASRQNGTQLFGDFVGQAPEKCYNLQNPERKLGSMPTQWCTEFYIGWGMGGRAFFNPEHVGFPFGNDKGDEEFYLVQIHYDNPEKETVSVDLRLDFFYTAELRENEGGVLLVGHEVPGRPESFLVPPNSVDHRIYGHCSGECTKRMLGPGGRVKIYGVGFQGQDSGRKMRLHHFRGARELPWVGYDDNWNSGFQQFRMLKEEREVKRGDQLTMDCSFDTTGNNGSAVVGGYGREDGVCLVWVGYYGKIWGYSTCASQLVSEESLGRFLRVGNTTWDEGRLSWVVGEGKEKRGWKVKEVVDRRKWDGKGRGELQKEQTVREHWGSCYREGWLREEGVEEKSEGLRGDFRGRVKYPVEVEAYRGPKRQCT